MTHQEVEPPRGARARSERLADTLYEAFDELEKIHDRGPWFVESKTRTDHYSFQRLMQSAARAQGALQARGLRKGDRVAVLSATPAHFLIWFLGAVRGGIVPIPIATPVMQPKALERTVRLLTCARPQAIVCATALTETLQPLLDAPQVAWCSDQEPHETTDEPPRAPLRPEDLCLMQFTSGSTGLPKLLGIRHDNIAHNATLMLGDGIALTRNDVGVSWLPLHHDMGLIGMALTPLLYSVPVAFLSTSRFIRSPAVWMETVSKYRGTISFGPNFAFDLAARRVKPESTQGLELQQLRVLGCGAEPIRYDVLERFAQTYAPAGLRWRSIVPSYGMAEATLGISFDTLAGPRRILLDRSKYEEDQIVELPSAAGARCLSIVSCGRTNSSHEIAIFRDGERQGEGHLGEICFRGPSVARDACAAPNGWLNTGDIGFVHRGDLYVSGRVKDMVIVNGRNFLPQEIETIAAEVDGVREHGVVAVAVRGDCTEELLLLYESTRDCNSGIAAAVQEALALKVSHIARVAPGGLPRTTSGKLQRSAARDMWANCELPTRIRAAGLPNASSETPKDADDVRKTTNREPARSDHLPRSLL